MGYGEYTTLNMIRIRRASPECALRWSISFNEFLSQNDLVDSLHQVRVRIVPNIVQESRKAQIVLHVAFESNARFHGGV